MSRSLSLLSALLLGSLVACRVVSAGEGARASTLMDGPATNTLHMYPSHQHAGLVRVGAIPTSGAIYPRANPPEQTSHEWPRGGSGERKESAYGKTCARGPYFIERKSNMSEVISPTEVECRSLTPGSKDRTLGHGLISASPNFIDRLSWLESRNNDEAIGDHGDSLGRFQMSSAAWADVNSLRRSQRLPEFQHGFAHDPGISREYCVQYLHILSQQFHRTFGRDANEAELLRMYRRGFAGYKHGRHKVRSASLRKQSK